MRNNLCLKIQGEEEENIKRKIQEEIKFSHSKEQKRSREARICFQRKRFFVAPTAFRLNHSSVDSSKSAYRRSYTTDLTPKIDKRKFSLGHLSRPRSFVRIFL